MRLDGERSLRGGYIVEPVRYLNRQRVLTHRQPRQLHEVALFWSIRKLTSRKDYLPITGVNTVQRTGNRTRRTDSIKRCLGIQDSRTGPQVLDARRCVGYFPSVALALAPKGLSRRIRRRIRGDDLQVVGAVRHGSSIPRVEPLGYFVL